MTKDIVKRTHEAQGGARRRNPPKSLVRTEMKRFIFGFGHIAHAVSKDSNPQ